MNIPRRKTGLMADENVPKISLVRRKTKKSLPASFFERPNAILHQLKRSVEFHFRDGVFQLILFGFDFVIFKKVNSPPSPH